MKIKSISFKVLLLTSGIAINAYSHQDPLYSQYMFNQLAINPAYTGYIRNPCYHYDRWIATNIAPSPSFSSGLNQLHSCFRVWLFIGNSLFWLITFFATNRHIIA